MCRRRTNDRAGAQNKPSIHAQGPLTDPTRNFRRDAQGAPVLGANGRPFSFATNALKFAQLTYIDRGARVEKEYLRLFPSLNASFNLREKLIARASYYHSIGRPNFNQCAGGVTVPNTANPPGATNRIDANNAGIKPWAAKSARVRLEYYFGGVGQISAGAFRRDFRNFWEDTVSKPTPEFLALYPLASLDDRGGLPRAGAYRWRQTPGAHYAELSCLLIAH